MALSAVVLPDPLAAVLVLAATHTATAVLAASVAFSEDSLEAPTVVLVLVSAVFSLAEQEATQVLVLVPVLRVRLVLVSVLVSARLAALWAVSLVLLALVLVVPLVFLEDSKVDLVATEVHLDPLVEVHLDPLVEVLAVKLVLEDPLVEVHLDPLVAVPVPVVVSISSPNR